MIRPGAVQQKIPCLFLTDVRNEPSNKRQNQTFKVLATETINPKAQETDVYNAVPTEKIDGTCCYVALYKADLEEYVSTTNCLPVKMGGHTFHTLTFADDTVLLYFSPTELQNKLSLLESYCNSNDVEIGPFIISYERRVTYKKTRVQMVYPYKQQDANVGIWKQRPRYYFVPAGKPYLWARLDRKPNKQAEKRFKRLIHAKGDSKDFIWNVEEDFKPVPQSWIPAKEMQQSDGKPLPDDAGHIPGWVPVEKDNKQYCWHSSVINYEAGVALVLRPHSEELDILEICIIPLSHLLEQTLELIGTNINSNPYELGSKKHPIHFLVSHGTFHIQNLPTLRHSDLLLWFETCEEAKVEGVVWHCKNGALVKLHRHHLGLSWPIPDARLNSQTTVVNVDLTKYECDFTSKSLFTFLSCMSGQRFERLKDIVLDGL